MNINVKNKDFHLIYSLPFLFDYDIFPNYLD